MRRTQRLSTGFELANELERAARTLWVREKAMNIASFVRCAGSRVGELSTSFLWQSAPKQSMTRCRCEAIPRYTLTVQLYQCLLLVARCLALKVGDIPPFEPFRASFCWHPALPGRLDLPICPAHDWVENERMRRSQGPLSGSDVAQRKSPQGGFRDLKTTVSPSDGPEDSLFVGQFLAPRSKSR